MEQRSKRWSHVYRATVLLAAAMTLAALAWGLSAELRASLVQAGVLSRFASNLTFRVEEGANPLARFPRSGPYNERLGYTRLPSFIAALEAKGYVVQRQARLSTHLEQFLDYGGFAVFREKDQAGLEIRDKDGGTIYAARHPDYVYADFDGIPPLIVATLLFIENRELLDARFPMRNPAVEWNRLAGATYSLALESLGLPSKRYGGSTLATQIEKYRHSPDGLTADVFEKLRQIASASVRAYLEGPDTTAARRDIVVSYLNSTPLAGRSGFGEVIGLGEGLWVWFGTDFEEANRALASESPDAVSPERRAAIYRQVLSLLLAQRSPSLYLRQNKDALTTLTDAHLRHLAATGIIEPTLRDAALSASLAFRVDPPPDEEHSFVTRKGVNALRADLLSLLPVVDLYHLDRLDLRVRSTLDWETQKRVTEVLRRLSDPAVAAELGLTGHRLLETSDASKVVYSITIYERGNKGNYLRVQADNLDQPFDINDSAKMDLGSTAKLRTLVSYLEIVAELHRHYAHLTPEELRAAAAEAADTLTTWVASYLAGTSDRSLQALMDAAMQRRYSANPDQTFFTGRGLHHFANFDRKDNDKVLTVSEAFRHSVNLVFIRMMRDIIAYYVAEGPVSPRVLLADAKDPARRPYLERFADREGTEFLTRFYRLYRNKSADDALSLLASRVRPVPERLAVVFRSVRAESAPSELAAFLARWLPQGAPGATAVTRLFEHYGPDRLSLADRAYLARIHPLEIWLVEYLQRNQKASFSEIVAAGADARQQAYAWLFRSSRKRAVDRRISMVLEEEAFDRLHRQWQRLGYPFPTLVPSYATAIGSSADRPRALAELMSFIVNDGVRLPTVKEEELDFAEGTPYETDLVLRPAAGEQLLAPELTATLRKALEDVVAEGTARRLKGVFVDNDGNPLRVGGKTGTGDDLADSVPGGHQEVSRSAAFVFLIGDRFFGTVTAHVADPGVGRFKFTSALPVQLLKSLAPALQPLITSPPENREKSVPLVASGAR